MKKIVKEFDQLSLERIAEGTALKAIFPDFEHVSKKTDRDVQFRNEMAAVSHYIDARDYMSPDEQERAISIINKYYKFAHPFTENVEEISLEERIELFETRRDGMYFPVENPTFTFVDLFAGIGGFRLALQHIGGKCIYASEWDRSAQKTYTLNYGVMPYGDITQPETKACIPDNFNILCAGFPCQAFSMAGLRLGFKDATKGTLFFHVAEIIEEKQPDAFFLENVKGLLSHDSGHTIEVILGRLREIGYYVPEPDIVNAMNFGVPQNRERVFIVGFHPRTGINEFSYPAPTDSTKRFRDIKETDVVDVKYYLSERFWQTLVNHKARHKAKGNGYGYEIIGDDDVANTFLAGSMGREHNLIIDDRQKCRLEATKYKGATNTSFVRTLTPREAGRLQGFPDDFKIKVGDYPAYKQYGNSVAIPAVRETAKEILRRLGIQIIVEVGM